LSFSSEEAEFFFDNFAYVTPLSIQVNDNLRVGSSTFAQRKVAVKFSAHINDPEQKSNLSSLAAACLDIVFTEELATAWNGVLNEFQFKKCQ